MVLRATPAELDDIRPGRPRDPGLDEAIRAATRALLIDVGYRRLSIDMVARRAGVTRPTIYRRWPSKMHLVHDAAFPAEPDQVALPDTGDVAADLRTLVRRNFAAYTRPEVRAAVPGLIADLHDDPALRSSVLDRLRGTVEAQFGSLIRAGIERGQLTTAVDPETLFDVLFGALVQRIVVQGRLDNRFADALVDLVLRGIERSPAENP